MAYSTFTLTAAVWLLFLTVTPAYALGEVELQLLRGLLSGNLALAVGIVATLFGLYQWLLQQKMWGLVVVILGVCTTAFPGIYAGLFSGTEAIVSGLAGESGMRGAYR